MFSANTSSLPLCLAKTIDLWTTNLILLYAIFPVSSLKDIFPLLLEIIGKLTLHGFRSIYVTSEGDAVNRRMFQMHATSK